MKIRLRRHLDYKPWDLEKIARRFLCEQYPEGVPVPVDIEYLLETQPGVTLDTCEGLRDQGVAGMILHHPAERRFTVYLDAGAADGLPAFYRFTVAEELAHLLLHRPILDKIRTEQDFWGLHRSEAYQILDRNAKRLAASLLMPEENVRADVRAIFAALRPRYTTPEDLQQRLLTRLAQRYEVSWAPCLSGFGTGPYGSTGPFGRPSNED